MFEVVLGSGPWIEAWRNQSARTLELLDLPSCEALSVAFREASTDSYQAIQSVYVFLYLALRPMLLLFHYAAKTIFLFLYKHIVVQGLYRNGLSQTREWSVRLFYFQRSLTRKQVLGEASFMVLFVGLYKLRRHVQDKQYYQRILVWYDRRKLQIVKSYESGVDRIATVSLVLAAMTPHMVFLTCCAGIKLLFPSLITVVACNSPLSGLLSRWIPWIATVTVIHDRFTNPLEKDSVGYTGEGKENSRKTEAISPPSSSKTAQDKQRPRHPLTPKTSGFFPRTPPSNKKRPRSRRSSVGSPLQRILRRNSEPLEEEEIYWIQYWSVHATLQLSKAIASFVPVLVSLGRYTWITAGLQQLELAFYVWIYILPWIIPETVGGMSLAEARPLPLLAKLVGPFFSTTHEQISSVVTTDFWQAQIVSRLEGILKVFVFLQLLSKDSAGSLVLCLQEGRSLLVPGLTLFMPGFITSFGVAYVQFVLPLSRTARGSTIPTTSQLQYWVLHVLLSSLFCNLASILWWIPFSSHAIFVTWAYISIPQKTVSCYESVREELQSFGILEGGDKPSIEQTRTAKVVRWVIHSLPAAAEVDGGGISSIDNTAQSESGSADISLLDRPHEDPPTPESPFSARGVSRDDEGYVEGDDCTLETARQFRRRNTTRLCRARDTTKNSKAA